MTYLTRAQVDKLLEPINPRRVGKDGKGFSHIEAYEARAHLSRVFGFARWSEEVTAQECIFEAENNGRWTVCYRSIVKVTVCAPDGTVLAVYAEGATGEAKNQPSRGDAHDLALKTSQSQAFKRAVVNLGDNFGLSLYGGGSLKPLVFRTLVLPDEQTVPDAQEMYERLTVDEHVTEIAPETPAPQGEDAATAPSPATPAGQDTTHWAGIIRDRVIKEAPTKTGAARKTFLLKQLQEAAAKGAANATVADGNGGAMSLEKLITDAMRVA